MRPESKSIQSSKCVRMWGLGICSLVKGALGVDLPAFAGAATRQDAGC